MRSKHFYVGQVVVLFIEGLLAGLTVITRAHGDYELEAGVPRGGNVVQSNGRGVAIEIAPPSASLLAQIESSPRKKQRTAELIPFAWRQLNGERFRLRDLPEIPDTPVFDSKHNLHQTAVAPKLEPQWEVLA